MRIAATAVSYFLLGLVLLLDSIVFYLPLGFQTEIHFKPRASPQEDLRLGRLPTNRITTRELAGWLAGGISWLASWLAGGLAGWLAEA